MEIQVTAIKPLTNMSKKYYTHFYPNRGMSEAMQLLVLHSNMQG